MLVNRDETSVGPSGVSVRRRVLLKRWSLPGATKFTTFERSELTKSAETSQVTSSEMNQRSAPRTP